VVTGILSPYPGLSQNVTLLISDGDAMDELLLPHHGNVDAVGSCNCCERYPPPHNGGSPLWVEQEKFYKLPALTRTNRQ